MATLAHTKTLYIALGVTTCVAILRIIYITRNKKKSKNNTTVSTTGESEKEQAKAISLLTPTFEQASIEAKSLNKLNRHDQLMLYGLYKQSQIGNINIDMPNRMNVVAVKKYEAWSKFNGMPRHFAMLKYIEVVEHFMEKGEDDSANAAGGSTMTELINDQDDIVYSDEEEVDFSDDNDDNNDNDNDSMEAQSGKHRANISNEISMGARQSTLSGVGNSHENDFKVTILQSALMNDIELLKQLILSGNDVNEVDDSGQTALHMAADKGNSECVKLLLDAGANTNAADKEGISVLEAAVIGGAINVVKLLLDAGADPDQKDMDGDTPRSCAEDDDNAEMRELLKSAKPVASIDN